MGEVDIGRDKSRLRFRCNQQFLTTNIHNIILINKPKDKNTSTAILKANIKRSIHAIKYFNKFR